MPSRSSRFSTRALPPASGRRVVPMAVLAAATRQPGFIFPEGAALAFGVGVLRMREWSASRWRIVVLVPLCALAGHLLACAHAPIWLCELTGITVALLLLETRGSRLAPALSAAVLAIVFDVRSWAYPMVVLLTCITVAATLPPRGPASPRSRTARGLERPPCVRGW